MLRGLTLALLISVRQIPEHLCIAVFEVPLLNPCGFSVCSFKLSSMRKYFEVGANQRAKAGFSTSFKFFLKYIKIKAVYCSEYTENVFTTSIKVEEITSCKLLHYFVLSVHLMY